MTCSRPALAILFVSTLALVRCAKAPEHHPTETTATTVVMDTVATTGTEAISTDASATMGTAMVETGAIPPTLTTTTGTSAAYTMHTSHTGATGSTGSMPTTSSTDSTGASGSTGVTGFTAATGAASNALNDAITKMNQLFASLNPGTVALDSPERMRVAETSTVRLRVAQKGETVGTMSPAAKPQVLKGVTPVMSAELTSDDGSMDIALASGEKDARRKITGGYVEWRWFVTPRRSGAHKVVATVNGYLDVEGTGAPVNVYTAERDVVVVANFADYIKAHVDWKWAWTALIVPLAGWFWAMYQRRRKSPAAPPK